MELYKIHSKTIKDYTLKLTSEQNRLPRNMGELFDLKDWLLLTERLCCCFVLSGIACRGVPCGVVILRVTIVGVPLYLVRESAVGVTCWGVLLRGSTLSTKDTSSADV